MVRIRLVRYGKWYMRKKRYVCKRYLLYLPVAIGDIVDRSLDYDARLFGQVIIIIPKGSENFLVQVEGQMENSTAGDGAEAKLYYGTAPAPSNGAAATGTQKGQPAICDDMPTASKRFQFGITTVVSGLTVGTAYWFDLLLAAITGGTASLQNLEIVITEL